MRQGSAKKISELLPAILGSIELASRGGGLLLAYWPEAVGQRCAAHTRAYAFEKGVLKVKVDSSTIYTLLSCYEKKRLSQQLQKKFPQVGLRDLVFKLG